MTHNTTPFDLPELDEVGYRLMRLWRLLGVSILMPVTLLVLVQMISWPFTGQPPGHFIAFAILCAIPVTAHAALFPNAPTETLSIGLGLSLLVVLEPFIRGFGVLRLVEFAAVLAVIWFGPRALQALRKKSPPRNIAIKAKVTTDIDPDEARQSIPLRPNQMGVQFTTGPIDASGVFAVMAPQAPDPFERLGDNPEVTQPVPTKPLFWARVLSDQPEAQETSILVRDDMGELLEVATVSHEFSTTARGTTVRETEQLMQYPIGDATLMRLTGYNADGLTQQRDALEGRTSMAIRATHPYSLRMLLCDQFDSLTRREKALT